MTPGANARELRALLVPFISKRVDTQDVEDVLQTVFVRIQRGLANLRDGDKLVAWAYQVTRNVIIDHVRRRGLGDTDSLELVRSATPPEPDVDDSGARELAIVLGHFIGKLPAPYREALQLTDLEGITQAEAAQRAGISLSGMKSRVQRARVQLRELLESCCDIELDTRGAIVDVAPRNKPLELPDCCARDRASSPMEDRLQVHDDHTRTQDHQSVEHPDQR